MPLEVGLRAESTTFTQCVQAAAMPSARKDPAKATDSRETTATRKTPSCKRTRHGLTEGILFEQLRHSVVSVPCRSRFTVRILFALDVRVTGIPGNTTRRQRCHREHPPDRSLKPLSICRQRKARKAESGLLVYGLGFRVYIGVP